VRTHELQSKLRVFFVALRTKWQHDRDNVHRSRAPADARHKLREAPGRRRIHTAADAEHIRPKALRRQVVGEKGNASLSLHGRVEVRAYAQLADNIVLPLLILASAFLHARLPFLSLNVPPSG
jgi:hypothetical protein